MNNNNIICSIIYGILIGLLFYLSYTPPSLVIEEVD